VPCDPRVRPAMAQLASSSSAPTLGAIGGDTAPKAAYITQPYGIPISASQGSLMGPHPMSEQRQFVQSDPRIMNVTLKQVYTLRRTLPNGLPKGKFTDPTAPEFEKNEREGAVDFTSHTLFMEDLRRHVRNGRDPNKKFFDPPTDHYQVGWHCPCSEQTRWLKNPTYPVSRSPMVKYYENLVSSGIKNVLRGGK